MVLPITIRASAPRTRWTPRKKLLPGSRLNVRLCARLLVAAALFLLAVCIVLIVCLAVVVVSSGGGPFDAEALMEWPTTCMKANCDRPVLPNKVLCFGCYFGGRSRELAVLRSLDGSVKGADE